MKKKTQPRPKMVVGKKEIGKKVWSVKKKSAKIVSRQKILVTFYRLFFTDKVVQWIC